MAPMSRNTSKASNFGPATVSPQAPMGPPGGPIEIVFTFDTTGSMYRCLTEVKQKVKEIIERLFADIPNLRIAVFAHGDYCDSATYVTKYVDFTNDVKKLCNFVQKVTSTSGGDWEECYELVLKQARELLSWTPGTQRALVMIGDAIPHPPTDPQNKDKIDWKTEAQRLRDEMAVRIYAVQAYENSAADTFWTSLAKMTYGKRLGLGEFDTIVDMMMAICYREHGAEFLEAYEREVRAREGKGIRKELDHMFDTLRDGDEPVPLGSVSGAACSFHSPVGAVPVTGKGGAVRKSKATGRIHKPKATLRKPRKNLAAKKTLQKALKASDRHLVKYTLGKQYRETVHSADDHLGSVKWSRWQPAMVPAAPANATSVWKPRREGGFGVRNTSLFGKELGVPSVYELAVQVRKGDRMCPVYLRSMESANHAGSWDRYLMTNRKVNDMVSDVLQKGCKLFIRRAKFESSVNCNGHVINSVKEMKKLMRDTYDYAWVKSAFQRNYRRLARKGVTISG